MKLDLGCGHNCREGFVGVDIKRFTSDVKIIHDLNKKKLPFRNNSIEEINISYVLYELKEPMALIKECWRILKPNGVLTITENYFASHYAYTPRTKNFWNIASARLFNKGYRDNYGLIVERIDLLEGSHIARFFADINSNGYEKYLSRVLPFNSIRYIFRKS